ncbi:hypothetical protein HDU93_005118, partial [Gonapodya sp. JEL0774]
SSSFHPLELLSLHNRANATSPDRIPSTIALVVMVVRPMADHHRRLCMALAEEVGEVDTKVADAMASRAITEINPIVDITGQAAPILCVEVQGEDMVSVVRSGEKAHRTTNLEGTAGENIRIITENQSSRVKQSGMRTTGICEE